MIKAEKSVGKLAQIFPSNSYNRGKCLVENYVIKGLPTIRDHLDIFPSKAWKIEIFPFVNQLPWKPDKTYIINSTSFLFLILVLKTWES